MSESSGGVVVDVGEAFIERVMRCSRAVLGETEVGRQTRRLCSQQIEARRALLADRGDGRSVIAVIGPTGQGKSWLVRQFLQSSSVRDRVRSGNNRDQATEKLIWIGPASPLDLDSRHEQFVMCEASNMTDLPVDYLLLDVPGATDDRGVIAAVATRALSLSSVLLLVARRDQLRAEAVGMLAAASEGSVVVPVINMVRPSEVTDGNPKDQLRSDIESFVARIREIAPESRVTSPVIIGDFEVAGADEAIVGSAAIEEIRSRISDEVAGGLDLQRRQATRLEAMDARFRQSLQQTLSGHLPSLTAAVRKINAEASQLPVAVAENLLGGGASMAGAIRGRMRLSLLADTPGYWFPYRSQLAVLNLTHGAWDRLFLSLSGSLPSLVSAVYSTGQNLIGSRDQAADIREGLRRRSDAAVTARLGPLTRQFRREIRSLRGETTGPDGDVQRGGPVEEERSAASLVGIDSLQEASEAIFERSIERHSVSRMFAWVTGGIGTLVFWIMMSGPILTIYRDYLSASYTALQRMLFAGENSAAETIRLEAFPRPDFGFWLTSLLLSILPVALMAMLVLSWSQRRRRVAAARDQIRREHHETIVAMQREGTLRMVWDDPLLADAEFLLSVGQEPAA